MFFISLLCIHFYVNMLTECPLIKFFKHFWQTLGNYNYHFQKEIRKSMNFKQDSEREIKRRERHGEQGESVCDLTCTQHRSQRRPYLP